MSQALLLSPDDQAVSAITGVLEEMSVSCERPLDGASAALKLNSHNFDLVLVDCENLPAAKLIFDVCRRGKGGNTPVPIAIVDGRAGLPTAFRLGADLILTKPVSKDNARTTIRTAMGRVKKEEPVAAASAPEDVGGTAAPEPIEEKAMAAAAAATTAPAIAPRAAAALPVARLPETAVIKAEAAAPQMSPAAKEAPASRILFSSEAAPSRVVRRPLEILPGLKAEPEEKLSDDPVLAEIDKSENEVVQAPAPVVPKAKPARAAKKSGGPVVLLALILAGGGFYAAWMYVPGFRTMIGPQVDRVMSLVGQKPLANPHAQAKPSLPGAPAPKAATYASPQAASAATPASPNVASESTNDGSTAPPSANASAEAPNVVAGKPVAPSKSTVAPSAKRDAAAPPSSAENTESTETSGNVITLEHPPAMDKNIVILSSKGAEKRLEHRVAPEYPKGAKDGAVVLKAVVGDTGKVASVSLVDGDATLAPAAMRAVKQWRYKPYARGGKNLAFQTIVMVEPHKQ